MSQRRQDERSAARERRREERRHARIEQRRSQTVQARPNASVARELAVAKAAAEQRVARAKRTRLYAIGGVAGLVAVALAAFLFIQQRKPLPGVGFDTNGSQHVEIGDAHGAYFSNPPTSGWMTEAIPNPGVYTEPQQPEDLMHFMEHGGSWILYTCPADCAPVSATLRAIDEAKRNRQNYTCPEGDGVCTDLLQLHTIATGQTDKRRPVALGLYPAKGSTPPEQKISAIAWQRLLSLDTVDQGKIVAFVERMTCRYNPEGPGWCNVARGKADNKPQDAPNGFNAREATAPTAAPAGVGPTPPPSATPAR